MNLSTKSRYAVMALLDLADHAGNGAPGAVVPLSHVSERQNLPITYLEQLFNKLRHAGLVESVRGSGGGYKLAKPAEDITIAEVMLAVGESFKMTQCGSQNPEVCRKSAGNKCRTHHFWKALGGVVHTYLAGVTLAEVGNGTFSRVVQGSPLA